LFFTPIADVIGIVHPLLLASHEGLWGGVGWGAWDWLLILISWQAEWDGWWTLHIQIQEALSEVLNFLLKLLSLTMVTMSVLMVTAMMSLGISGKNSKCE
tara:strand:- start:117 stop:416 length:300 start_codon:yes stop_codon:yes gene_type:complete